MLKVSVSCLSEEVFIHQTAGSDALEIVNLLRAQRDSWAGFPAQWAPLPAALCSLVTRDNLSLVKKRERWMNTGPKKW